MHDKMTWFTWTILWVAVSLFGCGENTTEPDDEIVEETPYETLLPRSVGGDRPAKVYWPKGMRPDQSYPVAVMVHGYSVNGFLQNVVLGLVERVSKYDMVLIVPEGTKNSAGARFWNAFPDCCNFDGSDVDDVQYLKDLVEEVDEHILVDRARISFVGHSNGGYMSYRMACEHPEWVRSIVVLAGSMPVDESRCADAHGVRVLHIHGTEDHTVPWANNVDGTPGDGHGIISKGAKDSVARWVQKNGCDTTALETQREDFFKAIEGEETQIQRWTSCEDDNVVEYWEVEGGDHLLVNTTDDFKNRIAEFLVGP